MEMQLPMPDGRRPPVHIWYRSWLQWLSTTAMHSVVRAHCALASSRLRSVPPVTEQYFDGST